MGGPIAADGPSSSGNHPCGWSPVPRPRLRPSWVDQRTATSGPWSHRRNSVPAVQTEARLGLTSLVDGVTVAQQILVLFVQVRILVDQLVAPPFRAVSARSQAALPIENKRRLQKQSQSTPPGRAVPP